MTIYYRCILIMGVLALFSCKREAAKPWKKMDFQLFTLSAPSDWDTIKIQGVDSYVGGLTNGDDTLIFDYGAYCGGLYKSELDKYRTKKDTINGIVAGIAIPITNGKGSIMLRIPYFKNTAFQFKMSGRDIVNTTTILKIFKTIRFATSDTTLNSNLRLRDFKMSPVLKGVGLFSSYCSVCHKKFDTPSYNSKTVIKKDSAWISTFFTTPEVLVNDTSFIRVNKKFEHYILRDEVVKDIIAYIKSADDEYFLHTQKAF